MAATAEWQIRVKALMEGGVEKEFQIATLSSETLGDFRNKLATKSHIEPQKQRLIFRGRLLTDNAQKVSDTGMRDGCALHMVARPSVSEDPAGSEGATGQSHAAPHAGPGGGGLPGMRQLLDMFSSLANGADGLPSEEQRERLQRTIRAVHRNFGANDGGEWIAVNANSQYFRVGREAAVGSQMTQEEFERGPIEAANPVSGSSTRAAYEPLPGIIQAEPRAQSSAETSSGGRFAHALSQAHTAPSQAQANELAYDLYENVLPRIRSIPGNSQYHFSSSESLSPTYLSQSTANPVNAVGRSLTSLGDAFVELGRSLQALGTEWQMQHFDDPIQQRAQSTLDLLSELAVASPLAVPFLQARLTADPHLQDQPRTASSDDNNSRRAASTDDAAAIAEHQRRIITSHVRRTRRQRAFDMMVGVSSGDQFGHPFAGVTPAMFEFHIEPISIPFGNLPHPPTLQASQQGPQQGSQQGPQQASQQGSGQALRQMIMQSLSQHRNAYAGGPGELSGAAAPGSQTNNDSTGGRSNSGIASALATRQRLPRGVRFMPAASSFEVIIERVNSPASGTRTDSNRSAPDPTEQPQPQPQRTATRDDGPADGSMAEAVASMLDAAERQSVLGSQSARSDRSNNSTTTEYSTSTSNEPWMRVPRIFGYHMGSNGMQPPQINGLSNLIDDIISRTSNPFPTASVFLGAESGSTTSTTRRASVSSSAGGAQNTGSSQAVAGNSEPADVVTSQPIDDDDNRNNNDDEAGSVQPADRTAEAGTSRTGETRNRTLSVSSTDFADADECSRRANSVANKRQRSDGPDEGQQ
ncbi:hypothetical protein IWW50_000437 [Coemansia erecta]|nr:hypothetical protein IWW50_000437 [Coemansia erecta]